ncbi:MAG: GIY-YIG nuclease family protein [Pseudomonadota bacterium]|jgi:hypothetical protein|nr:GIY-YIG nuclease family protein [Pseudomonadota bacterium]
MSIGRSVRIYLVDGSATGLITAEIINWTGHLLVGPRTRLDAALKREELKRTGVYLLYGDSGETELPLVYVGEGDDISKRLYSHTRDETKDYWERFIAVTSKDLNLTKAHVKYLESRLIAVLKDLKKSVVQNKTDPAFDRLPEADISDMETFLNELRLILPVVGVDFLRKPNTDRKQSDDLGASPDPEFYVNHLRKGIAARAIETDGEFVLLKGSRGSLNEAQSFSEKLKSFRDAILESGRAVKHDNGTFETTEDISFSSPSAAAVFLFGTSRNGRSDWLLQGQGQTYGDWKDSKLDEQPTS